MQLDKHIRDLLFQYDCVIIPDFGGFICSFSPAKIHPVQHKFYPPGKKISFNKMLIMNDGLLAHHKAVAENLPYNEALFEITEQVRIWKEALRAGKQIQLEGIGKFFNDPSGNLQFQYETNLNFLTESYGLTTIQTLPIDRSEKMKVAYKAPVKEDASIKSLPVLNKLAKYSVAAALLSVAALTAYKMQWMPDVNLNQISMNPFKTEKAVYETVKYSDIIEENSKAEANFKEKAEASEDYWVDFKVEAGGNAKDIKVKLKDEVLPKEVAVKLSSRFHVVGGCFGVEQNANKMMRKLRRMGYQADMDVMHKNLHVVSYQSFSDESEARAFLAQVKKESNNQAWLLVK